MKKYGENIGKLYEQEGFGLLEAGKTYVSKKGSKLTINEMVINANAIIPEVIVKYTYENTDGKKGTAENLFAEFVDTVRNS